MTPFRLLLALIPALWLAACATAPPPPIAAEVSELKTRLLVLVTVERLKQNSEAKPLVFDAELTAAAQAHCESMAKNNSFADDSAGNVAINTLLTDPQFQGFVGENAAAQYFTPSYGFDPESYAQGFMAIWLMSPQHASNIRDSKFEKMGIGVAINGNTIYAAELFATDLGLPKPP